MKPSIAIPFFKNKFRTPQQKSSTSWSERNLILNKNVNLFCWKRTIDQTMNAYLRNCLAENIQPLTIPTSTQHLAKNLCVARKAWNVGHTNGGDLFWDDVYQITRDFLEFSANGRGVVYLRIVDNNACTKFHTDGYQLRLFTTYIGKGTEWLPEEAVNRSALGTNNDRIVRDPHKVQQMEPGTVGILKGEIPNGANCNRGIVHRSPEIRHTGIKRIILRVDI